jgi:hypothetical protein
VLVELVGDGRCDVDDRQLCLVDDRAELAVVAPVFVDALDVVHAEAEPHFVRPKSLAA